MSLKKQDIARFKKRLEDLRDQMMHLVREVSQDVKSSDSSKGYSQHQADEGTDDFDRSISLQVSDEEFKILHYKCLGKEYVTNIYKERFDRLSESSKVNYWNTHYSKINEFLSLMDNIIKENKNIID